MPTSRPSGDTGRPSSPAGTEPRYRCPGRTAGFRAHSAARRSSWPHLNDLAVTELDDFGQPLAAANPAPLGSPHDEPSAAGHGEDRVREHKPRRATYPAVVKHGRVLVRGDPNLRRPHMHLALTGDRAVQRTASRTEPQPHKRREVAVRRATVRGGLASERSDHP